MYFQGTWFPSSPIFKALCCVLLVVVTILLIYLVFISHPVLVPIQGLLGNTVSWNGLRSRAVLLPPSPTQTRGAIITRARYGDLTISYAELYWQLLSQTLHITLQEITINLSWTVSNHLE